MKNKLQQIDSKECKIQKFKTSYYCIFKTFLRESEKKNCNKLWSTNISFLKFLSSGNLLECCFTDEE